MVQPHLFNNRSFSESGILADISLTDDIPDGSHIWNSSSLSKSSSSASSSDTTNIKTAVNLSETENVESNIKNLSNYTSCSQMPLLLYQSDQDVTVNL